ncbi:MAG TPA: PTS sugar transporter subunit IIB [Anaeromyxobacteraceae bacterium]|nr:PTS sugar transporter subunit IIB [Anaeromyxobacteraceae bacterium]
MILLVRVDNRLVHGQILETWVPRLGAKEVVVADDDAAASPLARAALTLCVPPDLSVRIERIAAVDWAALAGSRTPTLVILREVEGLRQARGGGLAPGMAPRVNLGNIHFAPDRRSVTASVFLSRGEIDALRALQRDGFEVEARPIPTEPPLGLDEIERRFEAAPPA